MISILGEKKVGRSQRGNRRRRRRRRRRRSRRWRRRRRSIGFNTAQNQ
jgi:hypothetical protein